MKKIVALGVISFALYSYLQKEANTNVVKDEALYVEPSAEYTTSDRVLDRAYKQRQSDLQVGGSGIVVKVLADDLKGSRHQKFILKLATGQTLLVAHNIDLAPRINTLREGDEVEFFGEYEWNKMGGVLHWTHHDPQGNHEDGWLRHKGRTYK